MHAGECLCGKIKYQIQGELEPIQICHCSQCRKAQGSAFVTNIPGKEVNFTVNEGSDLLKHFESSPGKYRFFCSNCGSPMFSKTNKVPGAVRIRAGTLEGDLLTRPAYHICFDSKANWFDVNDDLPKFSEKP